MNQVPVQLVECPRDAMQGWKQHIPTATKINYLNSLLEVGFDTLDCGSFVSSKAIPQMADTAEVLAGLRWQQSATRLLVIVANERGAAAAVTQPAVRFVGFPFSVSETFQQRNANSSIRESLERVRSIRDLCQANDKQLVVYLSMAFGNPYGDPWSEELVLDWGQELVELGVDVLSLADTVGMATADQVYRLCSRFRAALPGTTTGVHLHSTARNWREKLAAAWDAGIRRFDGALKGIGGCPMANDELVGNMNTEWMLAFFEEKGALPPLNPAALNRSLAMAASIFQPKTTGAV
ncbi:MAG TPA: hydroxymethylglutaryl-CoA lyase [Lacibacter sp.]|nr:hydroxymethylglutaryl-CoA lyase [Lacibacter sp.]HMO89796.1 hydroxymethylglutaryl-CoA lyase [Lacibacter sp.]HMP88362.1 hydroxymethylglutaryl-CoA lyase [Lacibacter sp.]